MLAAFRPGDVTLLHLWRMLVGHPLGRVAIWLLVALIFVHVVLSIAVFVHSRRVELQYLSRRGWTLTVLSSGVFAAIAYWIIHVSAARRDGRRET